MFVVSCVCFFNQRSAYEVRISDWSSDWCSSDLADAHLVYLLPRIEEEPAQRLAAARVVPRRGIAAGSHFTALEPRPCPDVHRFVGTVSDAQVVILVGADGDRITGGPGLEQLDLDRGPRAAAQYQPRRHHEQRPEERSVGKECVSTCKSRG